ncbi:MAG TPA: putative peptidoglycan-binding domain-containing protein [Pyrinomonadaceae bacterium]
MAQTIVDFEARRDTAGHIRIYELPANDGGGSWEYAGLNDRYHPAILKHLKGLVLSGLHQEAEALAVAYIANYTDVVTRWGVTDPSVEMYLRDCCFNRGPGGAAKILQIALGFYGRDVDGQIGAKTRAALEAYKNVPTTLLRAFRKARETYEDIVAPGRPNLRKGLVNRWNGALMAAEAMAA